MEKMNFNNLKYDYELKQINEDVKKIRNEINTKLDSYFIDETKIIYDVMMKDYIISKEKY